MDLLDCCKDFKQTSRPCTKFNCSLTYRRTLEGYEEEEAGEAAAGRGVIVRVRAVNAIYKRNPLPPPLPPPPRSLFPTLPPPPCHSMPLVGDQERHSAQAWSARPAGEECAAKGFHGRAGERITVQN